MSGPRVSHANYSIESVTPTNQQAYFVFTGEQGGATIQGPLIVEGAGAAIEVNDTNGDAVVVVQPYSGAPVGNGSVNVVAGGATAAANSGLTIHGINTGAVVMDYFSTTSGSTYREIQMNPANGNLLLGTTTSIVQVVGPTGNGQVYDTITNRPQPGNNFTLASFSPNLTQTSFAYTVATSGWYVFNTYLNFQAAGFSWPAGYILTFRLYANAAEVQYSQASWWSMPAPPPAGVEDNRCTMIQLTAGDVLTVQLGSTGLPALGTNGTVICTIKPILA
jgi:hypothetical protein